MAHPFVLGWAGGAVAVPDLGEQAGGSGEGAGDGGAPGAGGGGQFGGGAAGLGVDDAGAGEVGDGLAQPFADGFGVAALGGEPVRQ